MRKIVYFLAIPIVFLAAVVIVFFAITKQKPPEGINTTMAYADTLATNLPRDEKTARKELLNAEKAISKLKPVKPYIVIDTHANHIFLRTEDSVIIDAVCSTGSGKELLDSVTHKKWIFDTPRGVFKVRNKIKQPWWRKPDWEYKEEGEPIPKNESERYDPNMMGDYAMGFGDGFFIHGTIYQRLLGINVTHGCVRLGDDDLQKLWDKTPIGTSIYIF